MELLEFRNTLYDTVAARDKQWVRMVSWVKKNTEIPAPAVIRDDVSKKKKNIANVTLQRPVKVESNTIGKPRSEKG